MALSVELMGRGTQLDNYPTRISRAAQYIRLIQRMQNVQVANLEEVLIVWAISLKSKSKCLNWRSREKE